MTREIVESKESDTELCRTISMTALLETRRKKKEKKSKKNQDKH
jgi:hypothetical protein